jgi:hypothetical protein
MSNWNKKDLKWEPPPKKNIIKKNLYQQMYVKNVGSHVSSVPTFL